MIAIIVSAILAQGSLAGSGNSLSRTDPIQLFDQGVRAGRVYGINCVGSGVTCVRDGGIGYVNVTGGGGSGGKVAQAYMADASISAQTATVSQTSYSADASYISQFAGASGTAYSTDASYLSIWSHNSYAADASIISQLSYSSDAAGFANYLPIACAAGQYITCNGSSCSCGTPAGGGGSTLPGAPLGSVQYYSDAGSFGGMSGVGTNGTDFVFVDRSTKATDPGVSTSVLYFFDHYGSNGPPSLQSSSSALGFDNHFMPYPLIRSDDAWWGCVTPAAHGQTVYTVTGRAAAGAATGTAAAVAWAATDAKTRQVWIQHPAAATANTSAGYRANIDYVWRGNAAGVGGWFWYGAFALPLVTATTRVFVGLKDATAVLTATADPSAALDTVYFGCNAADANLGICSNDNVGTATCTTLGASFPCHTNNSSYDVALWSASNGASIGYWIRHIVSGVQSTGSVSTNLPRNTVQLNWQFWANTGGTASAVQIHVGGTCWIANP